MTEFRKKPKAVKAIPMAITEIDAEGKEVHRSGAWGVLPPAKDKCQICAVDHQEDEPHNAQLLYYQVIFSQMIGRSPTNLPPWGLGSSGSRAKGGAGEWGWLIVPRDEWDGLSGQNRLKRTASVALFDCSQRIDRARIFPI
jgi:hypothetical protein